MSVSVEKIDKLYTYERKLGKMANTPSPNNIQNSGTGSQPASNNTGWRNAFSFSFKVATIIVAVAIPLFGAYKLVISPNIVNTKDIEILKEDYAEQETEIEEIHSDISNLRTDIRDIKGEISDINDGIDKILNGETLAYGSNAGVGTLIIKFEKSYNPKMELVYSERILSEPTWIDEPKNTTIATGVNDKNYQYTSQNLQGKAFVTSYKEDGNEIYFYGRFNERNHWDGECILNVYSENTLIAVFEGNYIDGKLSNYKRVSCDDGKTWTVADRISHGTYTEGETWTYTKSKSFPQNVSMDNLDLAHILTTDNFLKDISNEQLIKYYNGETAEGFYNDNTENAYSVGYNENGNVRYLYKGIFKDGYGNDDRENAGSWAFIWGDANDGYHYHKGKFKNSHPQSTDKNWKYPKDQDFINSIVNPNDYKCPLTGLID